jgi:hypothetical protein
MVDSQFLLARQYIAGLEDCIELSNTNINFGEIDKMCRSNLGDFKPYQEYKEGHNRYALPLVTDELQSSFVSLQDGSRTEMDFTTPSSYLNSTPSLKNFIVGFDYGRSHVVWMKRGGYFPPHRDGPIAPFFDDECFRILLTIRGCRQKEFVTIVDNKVLPLNDYRAYYINSFKTHCAFSFTDDCMFAILNFRISMENARVLRDMI